MDPVAVAVQGFITVAAVAVGAFGTYLATKGVERSRWEREQSTRWHDQRIVAYTEYSASVKKVITRSRSILGELGLNPTLVRLTRATGIPLLELDEIDRTQKFESVMLLGGPEVIAAARAWHGISWQYYHWAVGNAPATEQEIEREYVAAEEARNKFYEAARRELGLPLHLAE
ncbi:hypothetical protein [Microbacterium sp. Root166]|uniref:hypothetical protein n=1 Tax=Microbacterium sp. Root166 TaxID=1736478 RepID=UPI0012F7FC71|nr:hypothetical protein [Microbacterium sp. Root166]